MFDPTHFSYVRWLLLPLLVFGRYAVLSGICTLLFYSWKRRAWLFRKIQQKFPKPTDFQREIAFSAITSVIFGMVSWLCLGTSLRQYTMFYSDIHQYSIAWLVASIPLTLLVHDAYFYWLHRWMHHPKWYRLVHLTHHKSVNPSPWAAYAFHPIEALLEAGIIPVLLLIMPLHPVSFFAFITLMLLFNVYGHLGYELFSRKTYEHPIGRWLNSSVHHNLHHEKVNGNYGLYFTIWDRLCGTLREDCLDKIEEVHGRIRSARETQSDHSIIQKHNLSMRSKTLLLLLLLSGLHRLGAQSINWASDIAPILYENCVKCHREGGLGHFSLVGYGNAFANRVSMQEETGARRMPPWMPDPSYQQYAHENRLSDADIQRISDWVDAGAPAGNIADAPPEPVFTQNSLVGEPDHMLLTPFFTVTATEDEYRCFVIPNGLTQTAYLRGLEAIPGNHEVVHHILIYEDVSGEAQALDAQTPDVPGYVNFGGPGVSGARLVGAWVPGAQTTLMPPFMGVKLTPGADLIVQMHYPQGVTGMSDMTTLNFFFTPTNQNIREVSLAPLLNHSPPSLQNGPLYIPANTTRTFHEKLTIPPNLNGSLISVAPHMHLIGRSITSYGVKPDGDTIPFIRINNWDFHWQGAYTFQRVQPIPGGTVLHAYATYDNTSDNPNQPSDPPQDVALGEATTDEMMLVYFAYMAYQPGDENIILDSTLLSTAVPQIPENKVISKVTVFPNPVQDWLDVAFDLAEKTKVNLHIIDQNGKVLQTIHEQGALAPGAHRKQVDVSRLPVGTYYLEIQGDGSGVVGSKFIKKG